MEQAYREDSEFDNSFVSRLLEQHRENLCKLFLGGLNKQVTDDDIREYFSRFGNVVDCVAIKNREDPSRGNKGFGFVTFDSLESVNNVMDEFSSNGIELRGKTIDLKRAIPKEVSNPTAAHARTKKCFVGGISQNLTQEDLEEYFKAFPGVVIEKLDFKGKFAFVEFGSENDADLFSIINLHSHPKQGHRPFEVKKSEPKGDGMRDFGGGRGGFGGFRGGRGRGGMPRGGGGGYQRGGGYGSGGGSYGGGYGGNSYGGGAAPGAYGGSGGYDSGFAYDNFGAPPASTAARSGYGASAYDSASDGSAYGSGAYGGAAQNGYGDTYAQGYGATSAAGYATGYGSTNGGGMGSYGQEASGFGPARGGRGGGGFGRGGGGRGVRTRPY